MLFCKRRRIAKIARAKRYPLRKRRSFSRENFLKRKSVKLCAATTSSPMLMIHNLALMAETQFCSMYIIAQ